MSGAKLIQLPKIADPRGNLTFIEAENHIPFDIKRAYWIYDVPGGETRGGHAFKEQDEFIVALSGSFDLEVDNGQKKERFHLNRSYFGLHIPPGSWRIMDNFSTNSLALVLASTFFDDNDYIRDYHSYLEFNHNEQQTDSQNNVKIPDYNISYNPKNTVFDCSIIYFQKIHFPSGNITPLQGESDIPFKIARAFYLYDIPGGEERGAHAHKECHQLLIAASGAFDVMLDDGQTKRMITLNRPYMGLHIPPGIWAAEMGFSSGAICLVMASHKYDGDDYIREYQDYLKWKKVDLYE